MSMKKTQNIKLETTASYQPLSDLNVRLWSQDKNTAELRFIVTRNQFPLSLSEENVKVIIALESGSSFISSDELIIDSEIEGVARYIIPTDFMRLASNVTGQVYVTTLDGEEVIVERQFKFTVSNDLLSDYPSEDKLRYIKTFDDLRTEIASRVSKLEIDMENMEDYVAQVQNTTQSGITALTRLINDKEREYNDNHTAKMQELDDKGATYSNKFDSDKQYVDEKFEAFKESVNGSGLITTGQSDNWQKHKLTNDNGNSNIVNNLDMENIEEKITKSGSYWVSGVTNSPVNINGILLAIHGASNSYKKFIYTPHNSNRIFFKSKNGDVWTEWEEVGTDPNKVETPTESQKKANTAENNAKVYTDNKVANVHTVLYDGSANGVGTNLQLNDSLDNYIALYMYGTYPGGSFVTMSNPFDKNSLVVTNSNIINGDGNGGGIYECAIEQTSRTKLKISNDVFFDLGTQVGSGSNANKTTITRIIGVRKNEITD